MLTSLNLQVQLQGAIEALCPWLVLIENLFCERRFCVNLPQTIEGVMQIKDVLIGEPNVLRTGLLRKCLSCVLP